MSPLTQIRPATLSEELAVNFPSRHRGQQESSMSGDLLKNVLKAIGESPKGIAALDFEGQSSGAEAYVTRNTLNVVSNRRGLDLQTTTEDYSGKTTLFVRRFKESG